MEGSKPKRGIPYDDLESYAQTELEAGRYLRSVFWGNVPHFIGAQRDWVTAMQAYINNPLYVGKSTADPIERRIRFTNALTSGSVKGLVVDFSWKRFLEGLVFQNIETMSMTVMAKRSKFTPAKIVAAACRPKEELLKYIDSKVEHAESFNKTASATLHEYFANTAKTAASMEHILLKILWGIIDAEKINAERWHRLSTAYVNNPENCPALSNRRSDKRNNLQTAMRSRKKISWKKFLEALKALDVKTLEITFKMSAPRRVDREACIVIDLTQHTFRSNQNEPD
ncbi:MAG: hypothetical protein ACRDBQ_18175 [Shewanella sp.]